MELPRRLIALSFVVVLGTWGSGGQGLMAQEVREHYEPVTGVLRIGPEPDRAVALTKRGHTLILPENAAQGVVVFIDPRRFQSEAFELRPGAFETEALRRDVAVLHVTTGSRRSGTADRQCPAGQRSRRCAGLPRGAVAGWDACTPTRIVPRGQRCSVRTAGYRRGDHRRSARYGAALGSRATRCHGRFPPGGCR